MQSFTHRSEVVKTKAKVETVDKHTQQLVDWFTCALSKVSRSPVLSLPYLVVIEAMNAPARATHEKEEQ